MISESIKEKLKFDKAACYLIDQNYEILYANEPGTEFCSNAKEGNSFLKTLCGKSRPCKECPLQKRLSADPTYVCTEALCSFAYVNFSVLPDNIILSRWNEAPDALTCMPEINLEKALAGMDGSREIYNSIAEVYLSEGLKKPAIIMKHYEARDYYNLRIEVHGLKGTSYVIGAEHLGDFAKRLEFACRDIEAGDDEKKVKAAKALIDSELDNLLLEYKMLLTKLGAIFKPGEDLVFEEAAKDISSEISLDSNNELKEDVISIKKELDDYNLDETVQLIDNALQKYEEKDINNFFSEIKKKINEFKYNEASELIDKLLNK